MGETSGIAIGRGAITTGAGGVCGGGRGFASSFTPAPAIVLRGQANTLVLRTTQIALTAAKGAGFLKNHPAQRWARQAMFFLVWSCPRPAAEATLSFLVNQASGHSMPS